MGRWANQVVGVDRDVDIDGLYQGLYEPLSSPVLPHALRYAILRKTAKVIRHLSTLRKGGQEQLQRLKIVVVAKVGAEDVERELAVFVGAVCNLWLMHEDGFHQVWSVAIKLTEEMERCVAFAVGHEHGGLVC